MGSSLVWYGALHVDGLWGKKSVKVMQKFLKHVAGTYAYDIDGYVGYYTARGMQLWLRQHGYYRAGSYVIDGQDGGATWAEICRYMVAWDIHTVSMSPPFKGWMPYLHPNRASDVVKILQRYLNSKRYR